MTKGAIAFSADSSEMYMLPPNISIALMTNRPEMLRVVEVETLTPAEMKEILRLLGDLIAERQRDKERDQELSARLAQLEGIIQDYTRSMREIGEQLTIAASNRQIWRQGP